MRMPHTPLDTRLNAPSVGASVVEPLPHLAGIPPVAAGARPIVGRCPSCRGRRLHYAFSRPIAGAAPLRVVRCDDCDLMLLNPQPSAGELASLAAERFSRAQADPQAQRRSAMRSATAKLYLAQLERYRGKTGGSLLEIGCGTGEFLAQAQAAGFDVTGLESRPEAAAHSAQTLGTPGQIITGTLDAVDFGSRRFDVIVLCDSLERTRDPRAVMDQVHSLLTPGGVVLIAAVSLDSWSARLLKQKWMEFKPEHLWLFNSNTVQNLLHQSNFDQAIVQPGWEVMHFDYIVEQLKRHRVPFLSWAAYMTAWMMPRPLRHRDVTLVANGMLVMATAAPVRERRLLSIVVPAFNEASTIGPLLDSVLGKEVPSLDIEVIVVESNSTDGTRQIVEKYASHPRVRLVLQDQPRGKGFAVRAGLTQARGDYVLIQDADLEYDLEDYDVLLEPLVSGGRALVLGSRHGGTAWWKMRHFADAPLVSLFFNVGHWIFTTLINVLFGQQLKDPFTMYKVFRRDCLHGLEFKCNRFDFDYELLIKMIRKGYEPLEIPVNYRSRSFQEGKKVSAIRDPLLWLKALARLRLERLDLLAARQKNGVPRVEG